MYSPFCKHDRNHKIFDLKKVKCISIKQQNGQKCNKYLSCRCPILCTERPIQMKSMSKHKKTVIHCNKLRDIQSSTTSICNLNTKLDEAVISTIEWAKSQEGGAECNKQTHHEMRSEVQLYEPIVLTELEKLYEQLLAIHEKLKQLPGNHEQKQEVMKQLQVIHEQKQEIMKQLAKMHELNQVVMKQLAENHALKQEIMKQLAENHEQKQEIKKKKQRKEELRKHILELEEKHQDLLVKIDAQKRLCDFMSPALKSERKAG